MKILLFANTDWYLYNFRLPLATALKRQGHEVVLVVPPGQYFSRLQQAGFRCIAFPLLQWGMNPIRECAALLRMIHLYRQEKPDYVHHFTIKCVLYGSLAAKVAGIRSVINAITGLGYLFSDERRFIRCLRPLVKWWYCLALNGSTVVFQNIDDQMAFIRNGLVKPEHTVLIRGSGVNIQHFSPQADKSPARPICVLFAARLLWTKGLGEFIEAAQALAGTGKKLFFKVAGALDPRNPAAVNEADLARWKESAQKDGAHIEFIGHQHDMKAVLAEADIVVLPSYGEGLPRILLEAAACGLPLVATDVPGCREVVQHGYNGFLVPVKDSGELVKAIDRLATNQYLRRAMGKQSRKLACEEFSEQEIVRRTLLVYRRCQPAETVARRGTNVA